MVCVGFPDGSRHDPAPAAQLRCIVPRSGWAFSRSRPESGKDPVNPVNPVDPAGPFVIAMSYEPLGPEGR